MDLIDFFTIDYYGRYYIIALIFGIIIGAYSLFRVYFALNNIKLSKNKKIIISATIAILTFLIMLNGWSNAAVFIYYLFFASILADSIRLLWKYLFKDKYLKRLPQLHKKGVLAFIIFAILVIYSIHGMSHIYLTEYNLTTDKIDNNSYSILFISDVHYSAEHTKLIKESILEMNELKPNIVILGGDIVDERTSKDDMKEIFKELGSINSTYGTYYIYGNHDRQPHNSFDENETRTFTDNELNQAITSNGIKILENKKVIINDDLVLIGREDRSQKPYIERPNVADMLNKSDYSKYIVVLDHQPIPKEEDLGNGIDLQLSGHTHGGQVFPFNILQELNMIYNYGLYKHHNMTLIVSSGLIGFGWLIRNEGKCEYVLVNIN